MNPLSHSTLSQAPRRYCASPLLVRGGALMAVSVWLTGCSLGSGPNNDGSKMDGGQTGDEFGELIQRVEGTKARSPAVGPPQDRASAEIADFSWSFYGQVAEPAANFAYSPYSLATAAAMLYAGAGGETQSEMTDVFRFSEEGDDFHQSRNDLSQFLEARNVAATEDRNAQILNVSNDFWMAERLTPRTDFLNILSMHYGAPVHLFKGSPEAVRQAINAKVSSDTNDLIPELLPPLSIVDETVFVLTNALYFKARWDWEFRKESTKKAEFTSIAGQSVEVEMMNSLDYAYGYEKSANVEILSMPYFGGELEFVAMMPTLGTFESFAATLTHEAVNKLTSDLPLNVLDLHFPKMEVDFELDLTKHLKDAGMVQGFDDKLANFSRLTEQKIWLSAAYHQTKIILDEEGTEAAAATAFVAIDESAGPTPLEATFDRPFVFFIRDIETQAILFLGHFTNPQ